MVNSVLKADREQFGSLLQPVPKFQKMFNQRRNEIKGGSLEDVRTEIGGKQLLNMVQRVLDFSPLVGFLTKRSMHR